MDRKQNNCLALGLICLLVLAACSVVFATITPPHVGRDYRPPVPPHHREDITATRLLPDPTARRERWRFQLRRTVSHHDLRRLVHQLNYNMVFPAIEDIQRPSPLRTCHDNRGDFAQTGCFVFANPEKACQK